MKRILGVTVGVALVWAAASVSGRAQEAPAKPAADVATLEKQKTDLDGQARALEGKLAARRAAIEKTQEVVDLAKARQAADSAYVEFVKNNADLKKLSQAREAAAGAIDAARRKAASESAEGAAVLKEQQKIAEDEIGRDYQNRLLDFVLRESVYPRVNAADTEIRKASAERGQAEQARREKEQTDGDLVALREARDALRAQHDKMYQNNRPANVNEAGKAYAKAEKAYQTLVQDKTAEARAALEKARQTEAAVRKAKTDADADAKALQGEIAALSKQRAEIEYKMRLADFKLQQGVQPRIARDPEVRQAAAATAQAEAARREKSEKDPDIVAARAARDEARQKAESLEKTWRESDAAVVSSWNAWREKETAYGQLLAEKTKDLTAAAAKAAENENKVAAAKYEGDPEVKDLTAQKTKIAGDRETARAQSRELETTWRKAYEAAVENADVKAAIAAEAAARKASEDGYNASEAPKLDQARRDAAKASEDKIRALLAADAEAVELTKQLTDLREKSRALQKQINEAKRAAAPQKQ